MKNWKTTVSGLCAALPTIVQALGVAIPEPISKLVLAVGVVIAFYFAKDKDVTGLPTK